MIDETHPDHPAAQPEPTPPADDAHVAVDSLLFSDPSKVKEDSVYLGHIGEDAR